MREIIKKEGKKERGKKTLDVKIMETVIKSCLKM